MKNKNKLTTYDIPNYRKFEVTYHGATNYTGSRIRITEQKRFNHDKKEFISMPYSYEHGNIDNQALEYLQSIGMKPVAMGHDVNKTVILCDNWAENFITLNGDKREFS